MTEANLLKRRLEYVLEFVQAAKLLSCPDEIMRESKDLQPPITSLLTEAEVSLEAMIRDTGAK